MFGSYYTFNIITYRDFHTHAQTICSIFSINSQATRTLPTTPPGHGAAATLIDAMNSPRLDLAGKRLVKLRIAHFRT